MTRQSILQQYGDFKKKPKQQHKKLPAVYQALKESMKEVKEIDRPQPIIRDLKCKYWKACDMLIDCAGCKPYHRG